MKCNTCHMDITSRKKYYFPEGDEVAFCCYDCMCAYLYRNMRVVDKEGNVVSRNKVEGKIENGEVEGKIKNEKKSGGWF